MGKQFTQVATEPGNDSPGGLLDKYHRGMPYAGVSLCKEEELMDIVVGLMAFVCVICAAIDAERTAQKRRARGGTE